MRILIVEDETIPAHFLKTLLENAGWTVVGLADRASKALQLAQEHRPDTVLMDVMIKGAQSGCEAALEIRRMFPETAIVFITAYADEEMIGYAVDAKADGYLLKPYNEREIVATLKLIEVRRQAPPPVAADSRLSLMHGFVFDRQSRQLLKQGKEVRLTAQMLQLLELLARAPGSMLSSERLGVELWGDPDSAGRLRTLVFRLRRQAGAELVEGFRRMGYRLAVAP